MGKIIDCFPFFNELDLLEIRLNELKDVVDVFVLVESPYTFTGIEKPLYFQDNKERFKEFNIVHPVYRPSGKYRPIIFDKHQKQFTIDSALDILERGDVLLQGDVDEIPKASVLKKAVEEDWESAGLVLTLFYYYMNCRGTIINKNLLRDSRLLRPTGRFEYNLRQNDKEDKLYHDAGWHFSFLGDVKSKLEAWGHAPVFNKPPFNTPEHIEKCKEQGLDLFERRGWRRINFEFVDDLSHLPQYVLDNLDKFNKYIKL